MIVGVIAEESLLALAIPPVDIYVDPDIFPLATIKVPGFLLFEGPFNADDTFYPAYVGDVSLSIYPSSIADPDTISPFTTSRSIAIVPPLFADVDVIYSPRVLSKVLGPQLFIDADIFGGVKKLTQGKATINQTFPIDTVLDIDIIYGPLVERSGIVVITQQATLITDTEVVHLDETVSNTSPLLGSFVSETAGIVTPLGVLLPHSIGTDDAIFAPSIQGPLAPASFGDVDVFYSPARLNYLVPGIVTDVDVVFASASGRQLQPGIVVAPDNFIGPTFTLPGSFALYIDAGEFISAPTVAPQAATAYPPLFNDAATDAFYVPTAYPAIVAPYVTDVDAFLVPLVAFGALTPVVSVVDPEPIYSPAVGRPPIAPALWVETDVFFAPAMGYDQTLQTGIVINTDTFYAPSIVALSSFDGTLALDGPIMPSTPPLTVIYVEG